MQDVVRILEQIDWEMKKTDLKKAFKNMRALPPHPKQNAIGFQTLIHTIPATIICYFYRTKRVQKLGAINFIIYDQPQVHSELELTYNQIKTELSQKYGPPDKEKYLYAIWNIRGCILHLIVNQDVVGLRFGNPAIDRSIGQDFVF